MAYDAITPGEVWLDTTGHRIHAHGGSVLEKDGVFYWYGENKERSEPGSGIWHWGVRCYSSTDLYNWEDRGLIIPPEQTDETSPLHPSRQMDRPHIIYNARTKQYVCWLKVMGPGWVQRSTVLVATDILGPYTMVRRDINPVGMSAGDFDLVVDPLDGKAYYYFERPHSELICADLTQDYTDVTGYYSTHFTGTRPPLTREAPAYFRREGKHYLLTSGTSWYFPNPTEAATASSYHGPWTVLGDVHPTDPSRTSFRSQISSVFRHPAKRDLFIALADRWLPDLSPDESNQTELFERAFRADGTVDESVPLDFSGDDTRKSDYVWLPIAFEDGIPTIRWRDEWRTDEFD